ncbi:MAG: Crp/Fnr family transcriptional regulator [Brumimicrobium sp.]|nr:Crp/Fnr family transcriptional regulator [Brumimicrobium sp.]
MEDLRQLSPFNSSPLLMEKMKEFGITKNFKSGDILLDENSYIRSIPIVTKGVVKVVRTEEDGREILLYYIRPGESCIMSFLGGLHNESSKVRAEVEEEAEVLLVPIEKLPYFMKEYPQWLDYIFRLYHKRFEELLEVVNAIAFKKMDERLLDSLEKKAEVLRSKTIQITHEQLANELGTARVVVSRLLKRLEEEGQVELGRNKIVLLSK